MEETKQGEKTKKPKKQTNNYFYLVFFIFLYIIFIFYNAVLFSLLYSY